MSERIFTLFGEEIIPEQPKTPAKSRAKKAKEEENEAEEAVKEKVEEVKEQQDASEIAAREKEDTEEEIIIISDVEPLPAKPKASKEKINLPEDWEGNKKYYSIGEVADLFKVKTSHIRFWTNEFKLKVRTTRKGDRLYSPEQIKELRAIHHLVKERGFTLTGAKAKLKTQNRIDVETIDLKQSLMQLRNKLLIIRDQLT